MRRPDGKLLIETPGGDNASLLFDRYFSATALDTNKAKVQSDLFDHIVKLTGSSEAYAAAYQAWSAGLRRLPGQMEFTITLSSPLALGLGNSSPYEVGLQFLRLYGMPVIPGSSLKGALRQALAELTDSNSKHGPEIDAVFGSPNAMSALTVFDAWPIPSSATHPFMREVMTPHHGEYYMGGQPLPLDSDTPVPVSYLAVKPKVQFTLLIQAPSQEWREILTTLLRQVGKQGIGAKVNSGMGRFKVLESRTLAAGGVAGGNDAMNPVGWTQSPPPFPKGKHEVSVLEIETWPFVWVMLGNKTLKVRCSRASEGDAYPGRKCVIDLDVTGKGELRSMNFVRWVD